ncbi:MAG: HpnL family protein [Sphingomonadales bacterium]|jgi:putative membrane protein|nr:HpnL family protein [Sphingomonadales bacterium]
MKNYARLGFLLATVVGLIVAGWTIGAIGAQQVLAAVATVGWIGMLAFVAWSIGVLALLGAAWLAVAPGESLHRLPLFIWARTTREAATDVLPFSQLGGLVVGARTLTERRVAMPVVYASMIADMTTELASQLLFTLAGVAVLLLILADQPVRASIMPLALLGTGGMAAIVAVLAFAQRPMLRLATGLATRFLPGSAGALATVRALLDAIYREPRRVIAAFVFNLLAWIASAAGAWIALKFMGISAPLWAIIALEALIFTLRSVAFFIPGAVGVQEAAYALIGPLFGLPPTTAVAVSLLKRARDLIIGVPALIIWQRSEYLSGRQRA